MKYGLLFVGIIVSVVYAYIQANKVLTTQIELPKVRLTMTVAELEDDFGAPFERNRNELTYILEDSSQLIITLRDNLVASALLKFHRPLRIEDPKLRQLTLVQMNASELEGDRPSWFYAGKPEDGLIYKITQKGEVETITWVPPFTYGNNQPKNVQALLKDFRIRHLSNL